MSESASGLAPSTLLRGGTVLTMDDRARVLRDHDVLVEAGRISRIERGIIPLPTTRVFDVSGDLVLPGLIQGHVHLGQTFFRGLAEGRRLMAWLQERIWPLEAAHDDESAYWCSLLGAAECLLGGTTTIQEIGIGPGIRGLLQAIRDSRLRAQAGMCLMDSGENLPPALAQTAEELLVETIDIGEGFHGSEGGRLQYLLNPRFILSCSDTLWRGIREVAETNSWSVHTHALEQKEETEAVRALKGGRDEIEYFEDEGVLAGDMRIAHGVWLDPGHLPKLAKLRFSVVHCPSTNLKLGSGIADVVGIRNAGVPVGIGADGAACNNDLDPLVEVRLAALLQNFRHGPDSFGGLDALRLATSEGARALDLEAQVGSLEVGKAADLLVLSMNRPEMLASPRVDLHDLVAFSASRAAVRHVLVEGELQVEEGALVHLDLTEIRDQAARALERLLARSGLFS